MDLGFLLDNYFSKDIEVAIKNYGLELESSMRRQFDPDVLAIKIASAEWENELISNVTFYFFSKGDCFIDDCLNLMQEFVMKISLIF